MAKRALDSPALRYFGQGAAAEGLYACSEAMVLWDEIDGAVANVAVAYLPAGRLQDDHPVWPEWQRFCGQWEYAFGSASPKWLSSDMARPEGLFTFFVSTGFASPSDQVQAIMEFGRIEECGWARELSAFLGDAIAARLPDPAVREEWRNGKTAALLQNEPQAMSDGSGSKPA